ncbi:hypothetical protein AB0G73_12590 [Streptomyces sp. NPDC020719]|uniref:hypothetical protein n=1 Tax=Streptomyces sp. NPDC020719 TaxID=3154896 RepID=UPI0033F19BA9
MTTPNTTAPGSRIAAAGGEWDAIRINRFYAFRTLAHLGAPGSVVIDPGPADPALIFFVPPGTTTSWNIPRSTAFGEATHVEIPAGDKDRPPGPYWLIKPVAGWQIQHIPVEQLRAALQAVLAAGEERPGRGHGDG